MFNCFKKKEEPKQNVIVLHKDETKYHIGDTVYAEIVKDYGIVGVPRKIVTTITGYIFDKHGITYKTEEYNHCINPEEYNGKYVSFDYIIKRKLEDKENN